MSCESGGRKSGTGEQQGDFKRTSNSVSLKKKWNTLQGMNTKKKRNSDETDEKGGIDGFLVRVQVSTYEEGRAHRQDASAD